MNISKKAITLLLISSGVLLGCNKTTDGDIPLSDEGRMVNEEIMEWYSNVTNKGMDFRNHHSGLDMRLVDKFKAVTNSRERVLLACSSKKYINAIPCAEYDYVKCDHVYHTVAGAYGAIQYVEYVTFKDVVAALEHWFDEMKYYNEELNRCHKAYEYYKSVADFPRAYEYENLVGVCEGLKSRDCFVIDRYGSFATRYCQKYPSRKKEFVERVKKVIGRYPRWYADEIKQK